MNDEKIVMTSSDRNYAIKGYVVGGNFGTGIPWCGVGKAVSATAAPLMN